MIVLQSPTRPATIRHAIADLLDKNTREVAVFSAYMSLEGSKVLYAELEKAIGRVAAKVIPKQIVASLDYGITEPQALQFWLGLPNASVRVAGAERLDKGDIRPRGTAYHPKVYVFRRANGRSNLLAGSANLTGRGLSANTEAAFMTRNATKSAVSRMIAELSERTVAVDAAMIARYSNARRRRPPPALMRREVDPLPTPNLPFREDIPLFAEEVEQGRLFPQFADQMWVEARRLEGGSGSQLELPRGSHRFFQFHFDRYDYPRKLTIGRPTLIAGRMRWAGRILGWHGDNGMERINLPTARQGGLRYRNSLILFRRKTRTVFEIVAAPFDSDLARSWQESALATTQLYRIGRKTQRLAGFIY